DQERSATGHGLTLHTPIRAERADELFDDGVQAWACSGTPSDCVKLALFSLLEVMGCGMVDPAVLTGMGLDPERWSGFAAGLGVERFCMVRHGIDDIRRLYTSDLRFLEQF
ncbi:MAG: 5'/3'-nucleotidase SurE, partial [Cyanobium sp.]